MMPFSGEGKIRALLRAQDWSASALGCPPTWPASIRTALQLMLDARQPACLAWGPALHFFYNDAYTEVLGEKHPAALLRPFWEVWAEVEPTLRPAVTRVLQGEPSFHENVPFEILRRGYPEAVWFTFSLLPIRADDGSVAGLLSVGTETTPQVQAGFCQRFLLALADSLRPLEAPDDITATACAMLGRHLNASRVFYCEVDDRQGTFFIRKDWVREGFTSVAGETRRLDDFGPEVIRTLRGAEPVIVADVNEDARTAAHAEAYRRIGLRAYLVIPLVKAGRLISLLSVHSDVPRRWRDLDRHLAEELIERTWAAAANAHAQAELRQALVRLKEEEARKDDFLALLAHELRNPLAPIRSAAELLLRAQLDEARAYKLGEVIGRQVEHITDLVEDLLDVSRVNRGLVELEKAPVDVAQIVGAALEQVQPLIESKNHRLEVQLCPQGTVVLGDEKRLVQVLANLLNNAAKYTPQGGCIRMHSDVRAGQVVLRVADNGIGIAPELSMRVFELFAQAERTPERASGGLGLGLALVKSLVELHGGTVASASDGLGRGSTFTVSLPLQGGQAPAQDKDFKVLVVDDNPDIAQMMSLYLDAAGRQVTVAHSAQEALAQARTDPPDVCLLDIGLPDMDGVALARQLRQQPHTAHTVLIAVTGYGQAQARGAAPAGDFDHYFVKPVNLDEFDALVADIQKGALPAGRPAG